MDVRSNFYYNFENERFSPDTNTESWQSRINTCTSHKISPNDPQVKNYWARNYPVTVPVTYFQGTTDGATQPNHAVHHYKHVPQTKAQLLLKLDGGHSPNRGLISIQDDGSEGLRSLGQGIANQSRLDEMQLNIFEKALSGEKINRELIDQFNQFSDFDWIYTEKNY